MPIIFWYVWFDYKLCHHGKFYQNPRRVNLRISLDDRRKNFIEWLLNVWNWCKAAKFLRKRRREVEICLTCTYLRTQTFSNFGFK